MSPSLEIRCFLRRINPSLLIEEALDLSVFLTEPALMLIGGIVNGFNTGYLDRNFKTLAEILSVAFSCWHGRELFIKALLEIATDCQVLKIFCVESPSYCLWLFSVFGVKPISIMDLTK